MVRLAKQRAFVYCLRARRHIDSWVAIEEIDRLEGDLDNFTWHDWKVLDPWNLQEMSVM